MDQFWSRTYANHYPQSVLPGIIVKTSTKNQRVTKIFGPFFDQDENTEDGVKMSICLSLSLYQVNHPPPVDPNSDFLPIFLPHHPYPVLSFFSRSRPGVIKNVVVIVIRVFRNH